MRFDIPPQVRIVIRAGLSADGYALSRASLVDLIRSRRIHLDAEMSRALGWIMATEIGFARGA